MEESDRNFSGVSTDLYVSDVLTESEVNGRTRQAAKRALLLYSQLGILEIYKETYDSEFLLAATALRIRLASYDISYISHYSQESLRWGSHLFSQSSYSSLRAPTHISDIFIKVTD